MKKNILLIAVISILAACTKKTDEVIPPPPSTYNNIPASSSPVSILNLYPLYGANVAINGRKLTNFTMYGPSGATQWFPAGTLANGNLFSIPDSLFDARGNATVDLYTMRQTADYLLDSAVLTSSTTLHSNIDSPKQIIRYPLYEEVPIIRLEPYLPEVLVVPVAPQAPSRPDYFKIRIINISAKEIPSAYDALTLTYADGTPVSKATSGVAHRQASDYVELPYGTYQFKIMDATGKPVHEYPGLYGSQSLKGMAYSNMRTFMPGGIYTLVVSWTRTYSDQNQTVLLDSPQFRWMKDNNPGSLPSYTRMQAVNALPGSRNLHFTVDGEDLGGFLDFGAYTDYASFGIGPHKAQVLDANNQLLSELQFNTISLDNITLWAWEKDGKVQLMKSSNDFSLMTVRETLGAGFGPEMPAIGGDGLGWHCRFINLSADVPFVTFLDQLGEFAPSYPVINYTASYKQLSPGYLPLLNPYVGFAISNYGSADVTAVTRGAVISAYGSDNAGTPGTPLQLSLNHPMIANPALYAGSADMPGSEPGLYTFALVGRMHSTDPADKARILFIKHNK